MQASYLPSALIDEKVATRHAVNKHSPYKGVDGSIFICSSDNSNEYVFSEYSLNYGKRSHFRSALNESSSDKAQFSVRSADWYTTGRYLHGTTVGTEYHQVSNHQDTWVLPIVSTVTSTSGDMV